MQAPFPPQASLGMIDLLFSATSYVSVPLAAPTQGCLLQREPYEQGRRQGAVPRAQSIALQSINFSNMLLFVWGPHHSCIFYSSGGLIMVAFSSFINSNSARGLGIDGDPRFFYGKPVS